MTIEMLTERVDILEKQVALLLSNNNPDKSEKSKKGNKKQKKNSDSSPAAKNKRISGYLMFINEHRPEAKSVVQANLEEGVKVKNTEVTKKLAEMWRAVDQDEKDFWNSKAKELKESS